MKKIIIALITSTVLITNASSSEKLPSTVTINTPGLQIVDNTVRKFADFLKNEKQITMVIKAVSGGSGDLSIVNALKENNLIFALDSSFDINRVINPNPGFDRDKDVILLPPVFSPTFLIVSSKVKNIPNIDILKQKIISKEKLNVGISGSFPLYYNAAYNKSIGMPNKIENSEIIYYKTYPELAIALMRGDVDYAYVAAFPLFTENLEIVKLAALGPVEYPGIPLLSKNTPDLGIAPKSMFAVPKNMEKYVPELIILFTDF